MKKLLVTLSLFVLASIANAQTHYPEFWLEMKWFMNDKPGQNRSIAFGYDPIANDSLAQKGKNPRDTAWLENISGGEQLIPPPFAEDVRFTGATIDRGYLEDGTYVDIRKKPSTNGFTLTYEISIRMTNEMQSLSLIWDKAKIPEIIKHIILEPATIGPGPARKKTDMKIASQLDLPNRDSISKYSKTLVTLYYNQEVSVSTDHTAEGVTLNVYPNPMQEMSTVTIQTPRVGNVQLEVYDPLGRKITSRSMDAIQGINTVELNRNEFPAAGLYYVRMMTMSGGQPIITTKAFQVF